ncbi:hypothetical protein L9F63_006216, partial [Diploptera punctata]
SSFHKLNNCSLTSFSSKMVLLPTGPMKFVRLWTTFSLAVGLSKTFVIFKLDVVIWISKLGPFERSTLCINFLAALIFSHPILMLS